MKLNINQQFAFKLLGYLPFGDIQINWVRGTSAACQIGGVFVDGRLICCFKRDNNFND